MQSENRINGKGRSEHEKKVKLIAHKVGERKSEVF